MANEGDIPIPTRCGAWPTEVEKVRRKCEKAAAQQRRFARLSADQMSCSVEAFEVPGFAGVRVVTATPPDGRTRLIEYLLAPPTKRDRWGVLGQLTSSGKAKLASELVESFESMLASVRARGESPGD